MGCPGPVSMVTASLSDSETKYEKIPLKLQISCD